MVIRLDMFGWARERSLHSTGGADTAKVTLTATPMRHAPPLYNHGPGGEAGAAASSGKGWGGGSLGAVGTGGVMVRAWDSRGAPLKQLGPSRERTA